MQRRPPTLRQLRTALATVVVLGAGTAVAEEPGLEALSVEELLQVEVYSVSKAAQEVIAAPAAVHVLSGDDLRRAGVVTLAEALRLMPGVFVAKDDASGWAVGVRGFASRLSRGVLVMVDGRAIYDPLFAGVFWEAQDTLLEDVERIEVIRGPGGTLWGANAVNGVVNVVTKPARATQGLLAAAGAGTELRSYGALRAGVSLPGDGWARVWAKGFLQDESFLAEGTSRDDWWLTRAGLRADWALSDRQELTLLADGYWGRTHISYLDTRYPEGQVEEVHITPPLAGASALARIRQSFEGGSELSVAAFADANLQQQLSFREQRQTLDASLDHRLPLPWGQVLAWGGAYRVHHDRIEGTGATSFEPSERWLHLATVYLQDELPLWEGRVRLVGGMKLERGFFGQLDYLPNARALVRLSRRHALWAAASRAARAPSRIERDVDVMALLSERGPLFLHLSGSEGFRSEILLAYEAGYRVVPVDQVGFEVALFSNRYPNLLSVDSESPSFRGPPPHLVIEARPGNARAVRALGGEATLTLGPFRGAWLSAAYSYLDLAKVRMDEARGAAAGPAREVSPKSLASVRAWAELPLGLELHLHLRYVSRLGPLQIDPYAELDARAAWRASSSVRLEAIARNLLHDHHPELSRETQPQRALFLRVTYQP